MYFTVLNVLLIQLLMFLDNCQKKITINTRQPPLIINYWSYSTLSHQVVPTQATLLIPSYPFTTMKSSPQSDWAAVPIHTILSVSYCPILPIFLSLPPPFHMFGLSPTSPQNWVCLFLPTVILYPGHHSLRTVINAHTLLMIPLLCIIYTI